MEQPLLYGMAPAEMAQPVFYSMAPAETAQPALYGISPAQMAQSALHGMAPVEMAQPAWYGMAPAQMAQPALYGMAQEMDPPQCLDFEEETAFLRSQLPVSCEAPMVESVCFDSCTPAGSNPAGQGVQLKFLHCS